jgi:hypothetical protein
MAILNSTCPSVFKINHRYRNPHKVVCGQACCGPPEIFGLGKAFTVDLNPLDTRSVLVPDSVRLTVIVLQALFCLMGSLIANGMESGSVHGKG